MTRRQRGQDRRGKRRNANPDDILFDVSDDAEPALGDDDYAFDLDYLGDEDLEVFDDLDPYDLPRKR